MRRGVYPDDKSKFNCVRCTSRSPITESNIEKKKRKKNKKKEKERKKRLSVNVVSTLKRKDSS